jgi:hypothetical protein
MKIAENIRKEVQGLNKSVIDTNKSKYNNELYMDECGVCGKPAIDTHHINYQCDADEEGFFKEYHKNIKHNLVPLCKECHIKEHTNKIDIKGYTQTTKGIVLNVDKIEETIKIDIKEEIIDINIKDEKIKIDYENLKQYIRRGKTNWYVRTKKTSAFRKNTNEKKIIDIINKLEDINISIIGDDMYNNLFDPSL